MTCPKRKLPNCFAFLLRTTMSPRGASCKASAPGQDGRPGQRNWDLWHAMHSDDAKDISTIQALDS